MQITRKIMKSKTLCGVGALAFILLCSLPGCSQQKTFFPSHVFLSDLDEPPLACTATQLYDEYMADSSAARSKYLGKKVWVTQAVVDTCYQEGEESFLTINVTDPTVMLGNTRSPLITVCTALIELNDRDIIEIVGTCESLSEQGITLSFDRVSNLGVAATLTSPPRY